MQNKQTINHILQCCMPLFRACHDFQHFQLSQENFRDQILNLFIKFNQNLSFLEISSTAIISIKYALAAFIDEIVLNSTWSGRTQWMGHSLQGEYFNEHLAGEGFFQRLNQLRQNSVVLIDLLEIYYVCLQLGFKGVYKLRSEEQLSALILGVRDQIEAIRGPCDASLIIKNTSQEKSEKIINTSSPNVVTYVVPIWMISIIVIGLICLFYFVCDIAIATQTRQALKQIQQNIDLLTPSPLLLNQDVSHD